MGMRQVGDGRRLAGAASRPGRHGAALLRGRRIPVPVAQFLLLGLVIALWQTASGVGWVDPAALPPPSAVLQTAAAMLVSHAFLDNAGDTALRVATAFAIGAPFAISFGLFVGEHMRLQRVVAPVFQFAMAIPQSIFLPIFMLLLGIGFAEKVVYGITHVVFVVTVSTIAAVRQVPRPWFAAARSFGFKPSQIYYKIYLPAMAPVIVTGLRLGLIFNIIGVLLAEMYASQTGLGVLLMRWGADYDTQRTLAATILISCATILVNEGMRVWERRVGRWSAEP